MATTVKEARRNPAKLEPWRGSDSVVLEGVPWAAYEMLRDVPENRNMRMTYDDGRLEIASSQYRHEKFAGLFGKVGMATAGVFGIPCLEAGATTFRIKGRGTNKGKGKEPDTCFYVGANEAKIRGKENIVLPQDPPPDLAIEVDYSTDSRTEFSIYASFGVPELWRYDGAELWFGKLSKDGTYWKINHSLALPMLTPKLVMSWIDRCTAMAESAWLVQLPAWIRSECSAPPQPGE